MAAEPIEKRIDKALRDVAAVNPVFPHEAKRQMAALIEEQLRAKVNMDSLLSRGNSAQQIGGFLAEEFHATTFNMDAILKGSSARAETGMSGGAISNNNHRVDLAVVEDGHIVRSAQSKFLGSAQDTANQHARVDPQTLTPKYAPVDAAVSPADQIDGIKQYAADRANHHATKAAQGGDSLATQGHQAKAEALTQTGQKVTATLEHDGVSSKPLTKAEADQMGAGDTSALETVQGSFKTRSTVQQMGNAAAGAAAMGAVLAGSMNILRYLTEVRAGRLTAGEATVKIVAETAASAADSTAKAALTTGAHSVLARAGGAAAVAPLAQQGLGAVLRSSAVTVVVVGAVNMAKDLVLLAKGDISASQFEERQGKGVLLTAAGGVGGHLGAAVVPVVAGASMLPVAIAGVVGGMVTSMAMQYAIEAGIEKPYREFIADTTALQEGAVLLDQVARDVFDGQVRFGAFLGVDAQLDRTTRGVLGAGTEGAARLHAAVEKI